MPIPILLIGGINLLKMLKLHSSGRDLSVLAEYDIPLSAHTFTMFFIVGTCMSLLHHSIWDDNAITNHSGHFEACLSTVHSEGEHFTEFYRHH